MVACADAIMVFVMFLLGMVHAVGVGIKLRWARARRAAKLSVTSPSAVSIFPLLSILSFTVKPLQAKRACRHICEQIVDCITFSRAEDSCDAVIRSLSAASSSLLLRHTGPTPLCELQRHPTRMRTCKASRVCTCPVDTS